MRHVALLLLVLFCCGAGYEVLVHIPTEQVVTLKETPCIWSEKEQAAPFFIAVINDTNIIANMQAILANLGKVTGPDSTFPYSNPFMTTNDAGQLIETILVNVETAQTQMVEYGEIIDNTAWRSSTNIHQ